MSVKQVINQLTNDRYDHFQPDTLVTLHDVFSDHFKHVFFSLSLSPSIFLIGLFFTT